MPTPRLTSVVAVCALLLALGGCATHPAAPKDQRSPADPWEPLNRQIHGFNDGLDKVTFKPVAKAYEFVIPQFMRTGVTNFSRNLRTPLNMVANLLQGKFKNTFTETGRLVINTTIGIGGLFDIATDAGIERKSEDFGEAFGYWGIPDGPYVVVPFLGPRTLRDAVAIPLNLFLDPLWHYDNAPVRDRVYVLRLIDVRQRLFAAEDLIKDSPDKYVTIRESYLQNRLYLIYDGFPPEQDPYEDLEDFEDFEEPEEER